MSYVSIIRCADYADATAAVKKAIDLLGEVRLPEDKNSRILLKPNLLAKSTADIACTTHPSVFRGVAEYLLGKGYENISYGDSPGHGSALAVAKECGIADTASKLGIRLADFSGGVPVDFPDGRHATRFILANAVADNPCIINVCKMKTHMLERITGAQKNTFGCVFGLNKGASHVKFPTPEEFAKMLADLNILVRPALHIMDGVVAMEGNGPHSGTPKQIGVILASLDPVALDSVFASLVYLNPYLVPTNKIGEEYGVGVCDTTKIAVLTEKGEITVSEAQKEFGCPDFDVYRDSVKTGNIKYLKPFEKLIRKKPKIDASKCVRCGICVKSCPVPGGALHFKKDGKPPVYDYKNCIGCYCCQEMCPERAIYNYQNPIAKIADIKFKI